MGRNWKWLPKMVTPRENHCHPKNKKQGGSGAQGGSRTHTLDKE